MSLKPGLRKALRADHPNSQQETLLTMYSAGSHAPTPWMTKAIAKARRRNKLARQARRKNR